MRTYEGMFLLEAGNPSFDEAVAPIRAVLDRNSAEVLHLKKWDERRLAYEIEGRRRGLYVLSYFRSDPLKITEIEHDVRLNGNILRVLILSADHVSEEEMATASAPVPEPPRREYGDRGRDDRRRDRRFSRGRPEPSKAVDSPKNDSGPGTDENSDK